MPIRQQNLQFFLIFNIPVLGVFEPFLRVVKLIFKSIFYKWPAPRYHIRRLSSALLLFFTLQRFSFAFDDVVIVRVSRDEMSGA